MVFSSCIFLFFLLPFVYFAYWICPNLKIKNALLILASLFFYAFGEPIYIFLMIGSILVNYVLARLIAAKQQWACGIFALTVLYNIGLLVVFKYSGFLAETIGKIFGIQIPIPEIVLPIGISFYTFQALSYCIDVYRDRTIAQKNVWNLMLYISFFPQLIAGPIVKYHDIEKQLSSRHITIEDTAVGIQRFLCGLGKKLLIANAMAYIVDTLYTTQMDFILTAWLAAICYLFQIYFDFSSYSDMAIGLGRMFGFTFLENFNYPYIAGSIQEFWRRWHISLSTWFKEYLYIPLGGNRKGEARTIFNKLIVFMATGIWHGANLTFLVWGLFHGLFITLEYKKWIPLKNKVFSHIYTMLIVICGFVIFRANTIKQAGHLLLTMFTGFQIVSGEWVLIAKLLTPYNTLCLFAAVVLSAPVSVKIKERLKIPVVSYAASILFLVICVMNLATSSYNPFIYFRF